jgi:hypothetical protein
MIRLTFLIIIVICRHALVSAQVVIGPGASQPHPSAYLDIQSTAKGFLPPGMTTSERNGIVSPASGLMIYNTDCGDIQYHNGTNWIPTGKQGFLATPGPIGGPSEPCQGSTGNFYNIQPVANATGYHWTVPEGASIISGQGTNAITVAFGTTSGLVCATAFNECYKSGISTMVVNVKEILPVSVSIIASANPVCNNQQVTFTAVPVNGGSSPAYQWKLNGSNVAGATGSTFDHVPDDGDFVSCLLTSNRGCVTGNPALSNQVVLQVQSQLTINHVAGNVAPVTKTVTYGLVSGIPGEEAKCWITRNLGASQQASSVNDPTEPPAGWYWQFNRLQGFKHDGSARTPNSVWITPINENSAWTEENDPCTLELGVPWRIPTLTEYSTVSYSGFWNNWNGPWNSSLHLHAAGMLDYSNGSLQLRGNYGAYWSTSQSGTNTAWFLNFVSSGCIMNADFKATGFSMRCIK